MTQSSSASPNPLRRFAGPGIILLLLISLFAVAAYHFLKLDPMIEEAAHSLPHAFPSEERPEIFRQVEGVFKRNQTVSEVLTEQGLSGFLVQRIIDCARPQYNLARIKAGYPYTIRFDGRERFHDFRYTIDSDRYLTVYHEAGRDCLVSVVKDFPFEIREEEVAGVIESSLFETISKIGEKDPLAWELEDIFSSDIDFFIDIRKGDSFKAVVEKKYLDGEFSKYGAVLAASFSNGGKNIMGFRFEDNNGKPAYYDPEGKALKKSFLKSPLKYTRISSGFSLARRHPITKKVQPHLGVDYAAPVGTPVRAVAGGRVVFAGTKGANGRMVHLSHPNGYETLYLHLSRIAVKGGARVGQGDVIGYVGSSGLSTGPHLDFRIKRRGQALNPLKMIFPPGDPVPPDKMPQFALVRDSWMGRLHSE
ncbi:MAG: peptidoglycan DD-metalloendopeptidase family protein [Acidobacteria bacterium]|nr:peptidoglycan DD-metalloendopeptidase family protein [Acidobacteriota bacterium]